MEGQAAARPVGVWDLPTRLFHWAIVCLVPFSWWSAETGHLPWHRLSGYTVLGLMIFRVIWGVVGSETARFSDFLRGPAAVVDYLRGRGAVSLGHNPLGGLSVAAMLTMLVVQVLLGLFAVDEDGFDGGPLSKFVSFETGRAIAAVHHVTFVVLLLLIVLHLVAITAYEVRGKRLVGAMVTGRKIAPEDVRAPVLAPLWRAAMAAAAAAAIAWIVARGFVI